MKFLSFTAVNEWNWRKVKSDLERQKSHIFSMWKTDPVQIQALSYILLYMQNMLPKVGLLEETKEGGKEEENDRE
jgi:hypothetical protein